MEILFVALKTAIGVSVLAVGMAGYLFRSLSLAEQIVVALCGVIIMVTPFTHGFAVLLIGGAAVVTIAIGWLQRRQNHRLRGQES